MDLYLFQLNINPDLWHNFNRAMLCLLEEKYACMQYWEGRSQSHWFTTENPVFSLGLPW